MCEICDGASPEEARLSLRHRIEAFGWAIMFVEASRPERVWAYTIGLSSLLDHPELVVFGVAPTDAARMLNGLGNAIADGELFCTGESLDLGPGMQFKLASVHPSHFDTHLFAAWSDYYRGLGLSEPQAHALELVLPGRRPKLHNRVSGRRHLPPGNKPTRR